MKPGLMWNVKDSLVSYVEALEDGVVGAVEPASHFAAGYLFPWDGVGSARCAGDEGTDVLQFRGAVRFSGHWGALDVELRDPRIELDGQRGVLLVRERGAQDPERMLPFARLELAGRDEADGSVRLDLAAMLTGHGRLLLGGQYAVGQLLSPAQVVFGKRHD
ncbi:HtaA domain-containing protein [Arthrobacter crystallopoietes]|jgi:hypothetical protein|nr:HtaA domain-containing protein [Arthrobacter crystallopoietes]AUI50462.1 hypothetical protein AC20117_06120 [Arthrobacter crystallopoietes]